MAARHLAGGLPELGQGRTEKASYALPAELFVPEQYLNEGDYVQYRIPKRAGMELDFGYHPNRGTIEDQANAQDLIELHVR